MDINDNFVIYNKYLISHVDGTPLRGKKYFVLRLDSTDEEESTRVDAAMSAYKNGYRMMDTKTMREALVKIEEIAASFDRECGIDHVIKIRDIARDALRSCCRNENFGTPDEQARRFYAFCQSHSSPIDGLCDMGCPCLGSEDRCHCLTKWMSLPYQETERNTSSAPVAAQE